MMNPTTPSPRTFLATRWLSILSLLLVALLAVAGCDAPVAEDESLLDEVDIEQLSPEARDYVEQARLQVAELEATLPEAVILESIIEPDTDDEPYVFDLVSEGFLYEFHAQDGVVILVSEPELIVTPDDVQPQSSVNGEESLYDSAAFVLALEEAGASVAIPTEPEPAADILAVRGQIYYVDGQAVHVYEYIDSVVAATDIARLSVTDSETVYQDVDGGLTELEWTEQPHFYQLGNLVLLYAGDDPTTLDLLEGMGGEPFAGS